MTPDPADEWGPRRFGYMFGRLHIMLCELSGDPWCGQQPSMAEWADLKRAIGRRVTGDDIWRFKAGWFAAQRARAAGEPVITPLESGG